MPRRGAWNPGSVPAEWENAAVYLQERFQALRTYLDGLDETIEFGPIPGQLLPVYLAYSDAAGGMTGGTTLALTGIAFEARPRQVYLTVFGTGATVTLNVRNSTTNVLASNQSVSTGTPVALSARSDFAVDRVYAPDLNLFLVSVDAGTPIHVLATVILDRVQKVAP